MDFDKSELPDPYGFSIGFVNKKFGNMKNLYSILQSQGYYLPNYGIYRTNLTYLLKVARDETCCPKISEIKPGGVKVNKKYYRSFILGEINRVIK